MIPQQLDILAYRTLGNLFVNNTKNPDSENLLNNMSKDALTVKNPRLMYIDQKHPYNILIHLSKKAPFNMCQWT